MDEFRDPELERMLGRAGGPTPEVQVAYGEVQRRVRRVRRQRSAMLGAAACAMLVSVTVLANAREDANTVRPGTSDVDGTSPITPDPTSTVTVPDTATTISSTSVTAPTSDPPSTPDSTTGSAPGTTTASSPPSSPPTTPVAPVTQTFSGVGGSVTVRLQNGSLTLVSYSAAAGFASEVRKSGGDRVEVRFESDDHRTDIRVDAQGSTMVPRIDEG